MSDEWEKTGWHKDTDQWIWRIYDGPEGRVAVSDKTGEDTTDIYIIPRKDGWWIISASKLMKETKVDWIQAVQGGGGIPISGPFANEKDAKAAWRVMFG